MARSVGRLDFWNVFGEMTPYEIAVTHALWMLEPWGDDRADLRAAVNTLAASATKDTDTKEAMESLTGYLKVQSDDLAEEITPEDAVKRISS